MFFLIIRIYIFMLLSNLLSKKNMKLHKNHYLTKLRYTRYNTLFDIHSLIFNHSITYIINFIKNIFNE